MGESLVLAALASRGSSLRWVRAGYERPSFSRRPVRRGKGLFVRVNGFH